MTLEAKIHAKRTEIQQLDAQLALRREELRTLFITKAQAACPIAIGILVEYEPGKRGIVDGIGYSAPWNECDHSAEIDWTVSGRKINKSGEFGVNDFRPVGPATHVVTGTCFVPKGLDRLFG